MRPRLQECRGHPTQPYSRGGVGPTLLYTSLYEAAWSFGIYNSKDGTVEASHLKPRDVGTTNQGFSFTNKILLNGNSYLEIRIMSQIEKADALEGQD